jgi:HK97 family phage major capsid protein
MTGGAGAQGGFAVPFELDPTLVPTSNSTVNPYRNICRVVQITGNEWRGVTTAGITANYGYQAEVAPALEATGPVLAQPAYVAKRATAFVPVSIELTQDWGALQSELGTLIQDAKDDLEAAQFTNGVGTTVFPQGLLVGATTNVSAGTGLTILAADLYNLEQALGPRFRARAQFISNRYVYNRIRALDTAGGAQLWIDNLRIGLPNNVPTPGNLNATLLGYPANEASAYPGATPLTNGMKLITLGDPRYYVIVDRIGLDIELIPHIFDSATGFPKGQRGIYAFWRNYAAVLDPNAFRTLTATT